VTRIQSGDSSELASRLPYKWVAETKVVKILDTNLHVPLQWNAMPTSDGVGWCWVAESGRRRDRGL